MYQYESVMKMWTFILDEGSGAVTKLCPTVCNPWTVAHQAFLSTGILQARILEWVFPSPGYLPHPGIEPRSPALQADSLLTEPPEKPCLCDFLPKSTAWRWGGQQWCSRGTQQTELLEASTAREDAPEAQKLLWCSQLAMLFSDESPFHRNQTHLFWDHD